MLGASGRDLMPFTREFSKKKEHTSTRMGTRAFFPQSGSKVGVAGGREDRGLTTQGSCGRGRKASSPEGGPRGTREGHTWVTGIDREPEGARGEQPATRKHKG